MQHPQLDIDRRIQLSLAVERYLRSSDRFHEASREFTESCAWLRKQLGPNVKFVHEVEFRLYLVTSDKESNFDVTRVERL